MGVLVAVVVIVVVLAFTGAFGTYGGRPIFGFWGGFLLLFLILWVGFFVVRMLFWSRRLRYGAGGGYARRDPAVMVARERYARGQITREQYDQIMNDLGRRRSPP
jgi:putative membrane protein